MTRRRTLAVVAFASLTLASCGGGGSSRDTGPTRYGDGSSAAGGGSTTTAQGGASRVTTTTAAPRPGGGSGGGGTPTTASRSPATTVRPGGGGGSKPVVTSGPPGSYARSLLGPSGPSTIVLDVLQQSGAALRAATIDHVLMVLRRDTGKTVTMSTTEIPGGARTWTSEDLTSTADERTPNKATTDQAVIHVLAVHGQSDTQGAIGIAVRGDVYAVFTDEVDQAASPLVSATTIEEAVATHELGHLLGLVDLALPTHRGDPDHPGHSANRGSVMYWAIDSDVVTQVLDGPPATDYDRDDRDDLAALRNGA